MAKVKANQEAGERVIPLGGESFVVKFNMARLIDLEEMLDKETGEIEQMLRAGSMRAITAIIFVGTRRYHRRDIRTQAEVIELMDDVDDFTALVTPLMEAFQAAMPGMQNQDEDDDGDVIDAETVATNGKGKGKRGPRSIESPEEAAV